VWTVPGEAAPPAGRAFARLPRAGAFTVVAAWYAVAGVAAAVAAAGLRGHHPVAVALFADLVGTAVVFAGSTLLANASLYDPYWSLGPPVIGAYWLSATPPGLPTEVRVRQAAVVALVLAWSLRLTVNWARGWRGLGHEDWRYVQLRRDTAGRLPWWVVNLAGIELMPTLVVFVALLPLWPVLGLGGRRLGVLDAVALAVTAAAVGVETAADIQLRRFTADPANAARVADRGLWAWSRHPNYLGEIGFWWGLWLFGVAAGPSWWWTVAGPLTVVVLFQAASIPLMEQRLHRRRPGYADYAARVPRLLPLPRRGARPGPRTGPR